MWNAEYIVWLWLFPVTTHIVLPLLILCFWFFVINPVKKFFFESVPVRAEPVHAN